MKTVGQWIAQARQHLASESAHLDAELLAAHVTGLSRASLFAFPERTLEQGQLLTLDSLLQRRRRGEPMAYLTGQREFWSLPLIVSPGTLVPRPETELLVEMALALHSQLPEGCIVDLGTGSGAIAVALAQSIVNRPILAVERHETAIGVARQNIERFGLDRVQLLQGDWLDAVASRSVALVLANPPYLASNDPHLTDLRYEPRDALVSGINGLVDIEKIIDATRRVGRQGCLLMLEHGHEQGAAVRLLLQHYNYKRIDTVCDLAGLERVSQAYLMDSPL